MSYPVVLRTVAVVSVLAALAPRAFPASDTLTYQGVLVDAAGEPVPDGAYISEFTLFPDLTGGTELWQEDQQSVDVTSGVFTAVLGDETPFGDLFAVQPRLFLRIRADLGNGVLTFGPRVELTAAPYAFAATDSDMLDGLSVADLEFNFAQLFVGTGEDSTIGGGANNFASDNAAVVGGGASNEASGIQSVVSGGSGNEAAGDIGTVAGADARGVEHVGRSIERVKRISSKTEPLYS